MTRFLLTAALLLFALPVTAKQKPISPYWELIARSDLIARARLDVPLGPLKASIRAKKNDWIQIGVRFVQTAKQISTQPPSSIRYSTLPAGDSPSPSLLEKYNGKEVIVFLIHDDQPNSDGNDYFAGYTAGAVIPFDAEEFSKIANEVKQQQEIARHFDSKPSPGDATVRQLLEKLTNKQTQATAWRELLKLSRQDVPALIRMLNDQRLLGEAYAYLPNPPGFFEATAQYDPQRIAEAASILASYLVGMSPFRGAAFGGGSERERQADADGWRVWLEYRSPDV